MDRATLGQRGLGGPALGGQQHLERERLERRALGRRPLELTPAAGEAALSVARRSVLDVLATSRVESWTVLLRRP